MLRNRYHPVARDEKIPREVKGLTLKSHWCEVVAELRLESRGLSPALRYFFTHYLNVTLKIHFLPSAHSVKIGLGSLSRLLLLLSSFLSLTCHHFPFFLFFISLLPRPRGHSTKNEPSLLTLGGFFFRACVEAVGTDGLSGDVRYLCPVDLSLLYLMLLPTGILYVRGVEKEPQEHLGGVLLPSPLSPAPSHKDSSCQVWVELRSACLFFSGPWGTQEAEVQSGEGETTAAISRA